MIHYRCKHTVEAMQWHDTDENREAFAAWFESHDAEFVTRGTHIELPDAQPNDPIVIETDWILFDGEVWMVMDADAFAEGYEVAP